MKEEYLEDIARLEAYEMEEILKKFLDTFFGKDYILEFRIKSLAKMKLKQKLYAERKGSCELEDIPDIIGFRIAVDREDDVHELMDLICRFLHPTRVVNFFNNTYTDYKAYNIFFEDIEINTEIQVMTKEMRDWTNMTHKEHDERKYGSVL